MTGQIHSTYSNQVNKNHDKKIQRYARIEQHLPKRINLVLKVQDPYKRNALGTENNLLIAFLRSPRHRIEKHE